MFRTHQSHQSSKHGHNASDPREQRREQRREEREKKKESQIAEIVEGVSKVMGVGHTSISLRQGGIAQPPSQWMQTEATHLSPPQDPELEKRRMRVPVQRTHTASFKGIDVCSAETKMTFENLVKYLSRESSEYPDLVYTASSVIDCISSIYLWARVDRNSPIKIPRCPGDLDVPSMYPEGSVVTVQKPTKSQEDLRTAAALNSKCDDDAMSAISGSITGHRRRRNNGSIVSAGSAQYKENWTRDMDPPVPYRGLGNRTVAVPQYNRVVEDPTDDNQYPSRGAGRSISILPGEVINGSGAAISTMPRRVAEPSLVSRIETPIARPTTKAGVNNFRIARRNKSTNAAVADEFVDDRIA